MGRSPSLLLELVTDSGSHLLILLGGEGQRLVMPRGSSRVTVLGAARCFRRAQGKLGTPGSAPRWLWPLGDRRRRAGRSWTVVTSCPAVPSGLVQVPAVFYQILRAHVLPLPRGSSAASSGLQGGQTQPLTCSLLAPGLTCSWSSSDGACKCCPGPGPQRALNKFSVYCQTELPKIGVHPPRGRDRSSGFPTGSSMCLHRERSQFFQFPDWLMEQSS